MCDVTSPTVYVVHCNGSTLWYFECLVFMLWLYLFFFIAGVDAGERYVESSLDCINFELDIINSRCCYHTRLFVDGCCGLLDWLFADLDSCANGICYSRTPIIQIQNISETRALIHSLIEDKHVAFSLNSEREFCICFPGWLLKA